MAGKIKDFVDTKKKKKKSEREREKKNRLNCPCKAVWKCTLELINSHLDQQYHFLQSIPRDDCKKHRSCSRHGGGEYQSIIIMGKF